MKYQSILILMVALQASMAAGYTLGGKKLTKSQVKALSPIKCKKSKSPTFKGNSLVNIDIMTNLEKYTMQRGENKGLIALKAIVAIKDEKNERNFVPVVLETRGNSRLSNCEYRPIRLKFLDPSIEKSIEGVVGTLAQQKVEHKFIKNLPHKVGQEMLYFQNYMSEFEKLTSNVELVANPQENNMFDKIGDDIKIVTHCGNSSWKDLSGETEEQQNDKVLGEYLIYKILSKLKTVTMKTRLTKITYRYSNGYPMITRYGMFRENKASVAKRCKLEKEVGKDLLNESNKVLEKFHAGFLHQFVYSNDYNLEQEHNTKKIYKVDGRNYSTVYVPYDFDLSGILVPNYSKNAGTSLEGKAQHFKNFIEKFANGSEYHKLVASLQVKDVLAKQQGINDLILKSKISAAYKNRFVTWHKLYFRALAEMDKHLAK